MDDKLNSEEKSWTRKSHLSTLLTYILPIVPQISLGVSALVSLVAPALIWLTKGTESKHIKQQAKESFFMQLILALSLNAIPLIWTDGSSTLTKTVMYGSVFLFHIINLIRAFYNSFSDSRKDPFYYPLSIFRTWDEYRLKKGEEEQILSKFTDPSTLKMYKEVLQVSKKRSIEIRELSAKIKDQNIRKKVEEISQVVFKIFENFKNDPRDVQVSRQILMYYLETTVTILRKYVELSSQNVQSEEVENSLQKVRGLLDSIKEAFEKHYLKLLSNDVMELDTEVAVMEKTMKMEGF